MQRRNKSAELEGNKIQAENKNKIQPLHHISDHLVLAQVVSNYEDVRRSYQHAHAQFSPPHPLHLVPNSITGNFLHPTYLKRYSMIGCFYELPGVNDWMILSPIIGYFTWHLLHVNAFRLKMSVRVGVQIKGRGRGRGRVGLGLGLALGLDYNFLRYHFLICKISRSFRSI